MIKNISALKKLIYLCVSAFTALVSVLYFADIVKISPTTLGLTTALAILVALAVFFFPEKQDQNKEENLFSID